MKASVHHVGYGQIDYTESFWTGGRDVSFSGKRLEKKKRNLFLYHGEEGDLECRVKGNFLYGVTLLIDGEEIRMTESCKWYEYLCAILLFSIFTVWANVPVLVDVFPIVGGALGGALAAGAAYGTLYLMRRARDTGIKLLIWLGMMLGTFAAGYILAFLVYLILP